MTELDDLTLDRAGAAANSLSRGVVQILDEQSAGMLAESIEKQRRA